jgi:hypothetical protein
MGACFLDCVLGLHGQFKWMCLDYIELYQDNIT